MEIAFTRHNSSHAYINQKKLWKTSLDSRQTKSQKVEKEVGTCPIFNQEVLFIYLFFCSE